MSKLDDNIQAVDAVRAHYVSAVNELKQAISVSEEGIEQGAALGVDGIVELFAQAKQELEAAVQTTEGLDQQLDTVVAILEAGKG
ncbi:hypothetical protein KIH74_17655 [Kineosporia sp. J2-2]|uniref:Uncharacterized protein n=1 Tax=Kineosporia corallincola TaxID=2835133 RepID=A0ABS5TL26_9ACTN|nr:hypothetical protein [Kineosporia corallincola]MBT0770773.1 hypothetical protein [Kineosporia corallincola]